MAQAASRDLWLRTGAATSAMTPHSRRPEAVIRLLSLAAVLLFVIQSPAAAQELRIDEFRFGGTWTNPSWIENDHAEADDAGITAEVLTAPVDFASRFGVENPILAAILTPRFHVGGTGVLDEDGTSYVYAGLTWHQALGDILFIESSFGGSLNNGNTNGAPGRAKIGSNVLFREAFAIGANLTDTMTLVTQIEHMSHAGLAASDNRGLTHVSVKLGLRF